MTRTKMIPSCLSLLLLLPVAAAFQGQATLNQQFTQLSYSANEYTAEPVEIARKKFLPQEELEDPEDPSAQFPEPQLPPRPPALRKDSKQVEDEPDDLEILFDKKEIPSGLIETACTMDTPYTSKYNRQNSHHNCESISPWQVYKETNRGKKAVNTM